MTSRLSQQVSFLLSRTIRPMKMDVINRNAVKRFIPGSMHAFPLKDHEA